MTELFRITKNDSDAPKEKQVIDYIRIPLNEKGNLERTQSLLRTHRNELMKYFKEKGIMRSDINQELLIPQIISKM